MISIKWTPEKRKCRDCKRGTRLDWTVPCLDPRGNQIHPLTEHNRYRLCQSCARRRSDVFREALRGFMRPHNPSRSAVTGRLNLRLDREDTLNREGVDRPWSGFYLAAVQVTADDPELWRG